MLFFSFSVRLAPLLAGRWKYLTEPRNSWGTGRLTGNIGEKFDWKYQWKIWLEVSVSNLAGNDKSEWKYWCEIFANFNIMSFQGMMQTLLDWEGAAPFLPGPRFRHHHHHQIVIWILICQTQVTGKKRPRFRHHHHQIVIWILICQTRPKQNKYWNGNAAYIDIDLNTEPI